MAKWICTECAGSVCVIDSEGYDERPEYCPHIKNEYAAWSKYDASRDVKK